MVEEHDHSKCEPNEITKAAMEEAKTGKTNFEELLEELRKDREDRLDWLIEDMFQRNKKILDSIGSDYDEDGVPYWEKWDNKNE